MRLSILNYVLMLFTSKSLSSKLSLGNYPRMSFKQGKNSLVSNCISKRAYSPNINDGNKKYEMYSGHFKNNVESIEDGVTREGHT